jgi:branched-subunit amino acid transport protein AzlD
MLIVFCLRSESLSAGGRASRRFCPFGAVILLHLWKRNNLISIFGGTALYILLTRFVFPG